MNTKFIVLIAAALFFAIGTQAETNAVNYRGEIRHDRVAMVHARNDIRADRMDMHYDRRIGDRRDYFYDRQDLRVDRRDYFRDRNDLHRELRDRRCW
jgi:hypothetical protein